MKDPLVFLRESGFLDSYIQDYTHSGSNIFDDFFKEYSDETYPVQITVKVPKPDDEVYITGNQPELGSWNPSMVKMHRKKLTREPSTSGSIFLPNLSLPVVAGAGRQR
ncbi:carbohydrate-binding module family 20 domain-containing protein [Chryseobacterium camelliae]|uniref:carbohydrate-binding module family 20 domain-containing protein n=1 Tax=Chryseobacterium camelliae TaxID=1265445 RepID=UPI000C1CB6C0|nr:carbohydrate-binding module family 20 domain-containing protein [Chryseobacterium camelliae]